MKRIKEHRYMYRRGEVLLFRRAVPVRFRSHFGGKREVQKSLETNVIAEARHRWSRELAKFEATLSRAKRESAGPVPMEACAIPSLAEIEEGVRAWLTERMLRADPGDVTNPENLGEALRKVADLDALSASVAASTELGSGGPATMTEWIADALIERNRWDIAPGSDLYRRLLRVVARGQVEATEQQLQDLRGKPRRIGDDTFAPEQYRLDAERARSRKDQSPKRLLELFDGYVAERKPKASTIKAWKRQLQAFIDFVGHDDAGRIIHQNVLDWKEHLLLKPTRLGTVLTARTVKDTYLSALKAVFGWAVENAHLKDNPATQVRVRSPKKQKLRSAGLTDEEALIILRGTMLQPPGRLTEERAFARRWVPWLCAYTGARVNEMTQLRREDVFQADGIWVVRITPEAGTVKSGMIRLVPLHPHILDQGFIQAIEKRSGPLFYNRELRRGGSDENPQPKKVGEHIAIWVRELGVADPLVQPNHGWRHRFKTLARLHGMDAEARDAIQGHVPRTEGEGYGEFPIATIYNAILHLPRYDL